MKIQIDTENKTINVIGTAKISDIITFLENHGLSKDEYSIGEEINPRPTINQPWIYTKDNDPLPPPYVVTCGTSGTVADNAFATNTKI